MLYLLQYESGFAYFISNESGDDVDEANSSYEVWVGHVVTVNLQRVLSQTNRCKRSFKVESIDEVNFTH